MLLASIQSYDYFYGRPYPRHAFGPLQFPLEKGPIPTALPYCRLLISEGAEFVFRNGPPRFGVADDDPADALVQRLIRQNGLHSRFVPLAEANGNQGAIAVKFSVDLDDRFCPVRFTFLSIPQECRVWVDPHDASRILMARIQYPYRDASDGRWYYYREEWTDDLYVVYRPKFAGDAEVMGAAALPGYLEHLGDGAGDAAWEIARREENPFGILPVGVIRNRAVKGNPLGEGDCWTAFRIIDRIALTLHGEDRASQMHSEPVQVAVNARLLNDSPAAPGEVLEITQNSREGGPPDYKLLEPQGMARQFSYQAIDKWEELLYKAVGLSRVDNAAVSNKGNMTSLAMQMTYSRTIATSDRKRALWAEGMGDFLRRVLLGLRNLGGVEEARQVDDGVQVSCEWPDYFAATDADLSAVTERTRSQVQAGFLTPDRGAERLAVAEGLPSDEVATLLRELRASRKLQQAEATVPDGMTVADDPGEAADLGAALSGDNNALT
jgi:hypothetical protein